MLDEGMDDAPVIRQVLAGDREAFGVLVARYGRRVNDLARRMLRDAHEAEDAVQQTFLNAFRALDRYDPQRPFRHWLLRIATNHCRNRLAARRPRPTAFGGAEGLEGSAAPDPVAIPAPSPDADERHEAERARAALDALPDALRETAVLRYAQGLSLEAIVEITGDPLGTVKTHLHRARAALAQMMGAREGDETRGRRAGTEA